MDLEQRIAQLSPKQLALLERKLKSGKPGARPEPRGGGEQRQKHVPLSFSQERLWFLEQMEPESCVYNLPAIVPLRGPVNPALVEASLHKLIARHSALRTRFVVKDDSPYQLIGDDAAQALDFATIELGDGQSSPAQLQRVVNQQIWVPFNLATGPLLRARLLLGRGNEQLLLVVMHHIVSDGWSINLFLKEFNLLYESALSGRPASLPDVEQYVDYAIAQRQRLQGETLASLLAYWRRQLEGAPPVIELPLDRWRPARQSFRGALHPFSIPRSAITSMRQLCRASGVVPFMVLVSALNVLLFRYTNQPKIVVGTPIANRNRSEHESVIGFFTNTLVLCSTVAPEMSFRQLLAQVRETTLGAYQHQDLPFEKLVSELQPQRSLSYNPIFQVMVTFQNLPVEQAGAGHTPRPDAAPAGPLDLELIPSKFDLTLAMTETDDELSAVFEYATDLFDAATIARMAGHFVAILEHVLQHPDAPITAFSFLSRAERQLILEQWNDTGRAWPDFLPLHGGLERWARATPDATALIFQETALSYQELDARAQRVAALLRSQGVGPGQVVGICLRRSLEMVIGLFAILKAGAAYMPIDPDFPAGRIAYMLQDSRASHVLTTREALPIVAKHSVAAIALDQLDAAPAAPDAPPPSLGPSDLAYIIFTSGSTGEPKGVMVSHGAIFNRLQWMQERYQLGAHDRVMQKTPFTFDVSVWEFFWPLSEGAGLVVAEPERHKESGYLVELIRRQVVTCLHFVPSMLQLFLCEDLSRCASLSRIMCSGEALTIDQCRRLQALPGVRAHNLYGPTEAAVDVTHWDCDQWRDQYLSVPIGRPIANTQIYILNAQLQPAPIGVIGELHIGGANLAQGYLNKPELTARRFIPNPFAEGMGDGGQAERRGRAGMGGDGPIPYPLTPNPRLYRTGDFARFRSDGSIEYIGRMDAQVKLRGVRIELGEIETVLCQHPEIAEAVVIVNQFGAQDERLAAYVVLGNPEGRLDLAAVRAFAARQLPSYMIPALIVPLAELPLTPNGKLDRKRLPDPAALRDAEPAEPASDIEEVLLGIWRTFLKVDSLKTTDDFFALGGHSILAFQVINSVNGHYQMDVPVRLLFENPTVKTLAKALSEVEDEAWLDDSRTAASMVARSPRHLLHTLDQLSEEQLDEILAQHRDRPPMAAAQDAGALLAWASAYAPAGANGRAPAAPAPAPAPRPSAGAASASSSAYARAYPELVRIRIAIEQLYLRQYYPLQAPPARQDAVPTAAELREYGDAIFARFIQEIGEHLATNGHEVLSPVALGAYCQQMLAMADLAASIAAFVPALPVTSGTR